MYILKITKKYCLFWEVAKHDIHLYGLQHVQFLRGRHATKHTPIPDLNHGLLIYIPSHLQRTILLASELYPFDGLIISVDFSIIKPPFCLITCCVAI